MFGQFAATESLKYGLNYPNSIMKPSVYMQSGGINCPPEVIRLPVWPRNPITCIL